MTGLFSSFFKTRKPRTFSYKPIYYNAEKEALAKRIELIKKEINQGQQTQNVEFRKILNEKWRKNFTSLANKRSNTRIIVIAGLLATIFYLLLR